MLTNPAAHEPLTAFEATRRYELLCADGTLAHSPFAWRSMAALLDESSANALSTVVERALADRAHDCRLRALRHEAIEKYRGCCGAGFVTERCDECGERSTTVRAVDNRHRCANVCTVCVPRLKAVA